MQLSTLVNALTLLGLGHKKRMPLNSEGSLPQLKKTKGNRLTQFRLENGRQNVGRQ